MGTSLDKMLLFAILLLTAASAACGHSTPVAPAERRPDESAFFTPAVRLGFLADEAITEASGIAASRKHPDLLWIINDGGHEPLLHAVGPDGADLGQVVVEDAENRDWEDLASFRLGGRAYLLIADFGDNNGRRKSCLLYIVAEPSAGELGYGGTVAPAWRIEYRYESGPRDAEGVAVDPLAGSILVLTKRTQPPELYELPLRPESGAGLLTASPVALLRTIPPPTAADIRSDPVFGFLRSQPTALDLAPNGLAIAVLTYGKILLYHRIPEEKWQQTFDRPPHLLPIPKLRQAESLCFSQDGYHLFLTSEKLPAPLYRLELHPELAI
jgi:hypothetical protein